MQGTLPEWLLISNCDNAIGHRDLRDMLEMARRTDNGGKHGGMTDAPAAIVATTSVPIRDENRFSFCHVQQGGRVSRVTEKKEHTRYAVAGVYLVRKSALVNVIFDTDVNFSQVLNRMFNVVAFPVAEYHGWNDMEQIDQWEREHCGNVSTRNELLD